MFKLRMIGAGRRGDQYVTDAASQLPELFGARTYYHMHWYLIRFKDLQHADMRKALCSTSSENNCYL